MRFIYIVVLSLFAVLMSSCGEKPVFSKKIEIDGNWGYINELQFPINVDNLDKTYDLIFSLIYGTDFGYQNIYVKIITQYPSGKNEEDILSLNLTDGAGLFLGNCNSSKCEIDLLLQEKFKFNEKGEYVITIIQNGRKDNLEGVFGAELKLFSVLDKN